MNYDDKSDLTAFVAKIEKEKRKKGYADAPQDGGEAPAAKNKSPAKKKAAPKKKAASKKK